MVFWWTVSPHMFLKDDSFHCTPHRDGLHFCWKSDKLGPILLSVFLLHSPTIVETVEVIVYPVLYSTVLLKVREDFQHSGQFAPLENIRPRGHKGSVYYTLFLYILYRQSFNRLATLTISVMQLYYRQQGYVLQDLCHPYTPSTSYSYTVHSPVYCYRELYMAFIQQYSIVQWCYFDYRRSRIWSHNLSLSRHSSPASKDCHLYVSM